MKKMIALVITLVLVGAFALSATMAYLTGNTTPVQNAFVIGDINITLTEPNWGKDMGADFKGKIIPGEVIKKDPTITVNKGSELCYQFVYLENKLAVKAGTGFAYVAPNIELGNWVPVASSVDATGAKKELYRYKQVVDASAQNVTLPFFTEVTVPGESFTKESMKELAAKSADQTTITVQAFAYQSKNVTLEAATAAAKTQFNF